VAQAPSSDAQAESDDASKPRKTGWWAKRIMGKG
jgi:hypothetical protein